MAWYVLIVYVQIEAPGLYFLPEGLDPSIQAQLLFLGSVNNNRKMAANRQLCTFKKVLSESIICTRLFEHYLLEKNLK